ncbi:MAG: pteridine reductase [Wenzhouxiangella sp.]|nr:pteridine reductase [Wenzhouxiangella sp.]MDR9453091.1 pteridine reductase [Wenzhouxiangella sp.]
MTDPTPVAIVTGGARRIGAETVCHLHQRGLNVLIHYRASSDDALALADALNQTRPGSAHTLGADLADPDVGERLKTTALEAFGRIDLVVNNASSFYPTPVHETTHEQFEDLMVSNLQGPFVVSKACAPALSQHHGAIINLVDIHAMVPLKDHVPYVSAKAGLIMQTKALAKDLAPAVRVNGVAPGSILWPESEINDTAKHEAMLAKIPLARQGEPGDIAKAVAFLGLDAPYITGQILAVDGGRLLNM